MQSDGGGQNGRRPYYPWAAERNPPGDRFRTGAAPRKPALSSGGTQKRPGGGYTPPGRFALLRVCPYSAPNPTRRVLGSPIST
ncbi:hypothetical protein GCM10018966_011740 [Streptomyces yanii]